MTWAGTGGHVARMAGVPLVPRAAVISHWNAARSDTREVLQQATLLVGNLLRGARPIDRDDLTKLQASLIQAIAALQKGTVVAAAGVKVRTPR